MSTRSFGLLSVALMTAFTLACGQAEAPASAPAPAAEPQAAASAPALTNVAQIFPEAPEKEILMSNCTSCHNVACSAIGQRSASRWQELKKAHGDRVSGVDLDKLFGYLQANFDDSKPEPNVPAAFLEGGCTPF